MNFFEKIVYFFSAEMTTPTNYGVWHIVSLLLMIGLTIFLCVKFKDCKDKTFRRIIWISWVVILVLEIYKQIVFSFDWDGNIATWDFEWYAFPFQLCSTPLYLLPFVAFLKEGKVRDSIMSFMATFAFFGGLATMLYPNNVYISTIGINIQTMVHHGLQVVLGIFIFVYNRKKFNIKFFLLGIIPFVILIAIAMLSNLVMYHAINETFNMFYISPYYECVLPLLGDIQKVVPYIVFLLIYVVGFVAVACIMYFIMFGIYKLCLKLRKRHEQKA